MILTQDSGNKILQDDIDHNQSPIIIETKQGSYQYVPIPEINKSIRQRLKQKPKRVIIKVRFYPPEIYKCKDEQ